MPFRSWLTELMSKFFSSVFRGSKSSNHKSSHGPPQFQKAKTGGLMSRGTLLVNKTDTTLYLRDKIGAAYGGTRYKILGQSSIEVFPLQHTFFTMIAYAVEEDVDKEDGRRSSPSLNNNSNGNNQQKKKSRDTNLSIDSDQLADNKRITITRSGDKYELAVSPRSG